MAKITIENFKYRGCNIERYECEITDVTDLDKLSEELIIDRIKKTLDECIDEDE